MMDWLLILIPTIASGIFGGAVATWLRTRPRMKEVELQGEAQLWTRIAALEARAELQDTRLQQEREQCDERIARIEQRHDAEMVELKGQVQVLRHDRNNLRQCFNAMIAMLKQEGADVAQVVASIEEMLAHGDKVIAVEKGSMRRPGP